DRVELRPDDVTRSGFFSRFWRRQVQGSEGAAVDGKASGIDQPSLALQTVIETLHAPAEPHQPDPVVIVGFAHQRGDVRSELDSKLILLGMLRKADPEREFIFGNIYSIDFNLER